MKIYWPWNNLGCLGLQIGGFYVDLYHRRWTGGFGLFCRPWTGRRAFWLTRNGFHWEH
jgi:hypothetical protein